MNTQNIYQYKLGKWKIYINELSNNNKVKFTRIENLLNDLVKLKEKLDKLLLDFDNEFH